MEIHLSRLVLVLPGSTVCFFDTPPLSDGLPGFFVLNDPWNFYSLRLSCILLTQFLLRVFA